MDDSEKQNRQVDDDAEEDDDEKPLIMIASSQNKPKTIRSSSSVDGTLGGEGGAMQEGPDDQGVGSLADPPIKAHANTANHQEGGFAQAVNQGETAASLAHADKPVPMQADEHGEAEAPCMDGPSAAPMNEEKASGDAEEGGARVPIMMQDSGSKRATRPKPPPAAPRPKRTASMRIPAVSPREAGSERGRSGGAKRLKGASSEEISQQPEDAVAAAAEDDTPVQAAPKASSRTPREVAKAGPAKSRKSLTSGKEAASKATTDLPADAEPAAACSPSDKPTAPQEEAGASDIAKVEAMEEALKSGRKIKPRGKPGPKKEEAAEKAASDKASADKAAPASNNEKTPKGRLKTASVVASEPQEEKQEQGGEREEEESQVLDASSSEYLKLDRPGKEEALAAAVKAFEAAISEAEAATKVLQGHVHAWHDEPFRGAEDRRIIDTMRVLHKPAARFEGFTKMVSRVSADAADISRLWRYIHEHPKEFHQRQPTAAMALAKAGPAALPPQQQQRPFKQGPPAQAALAGKAVAGPGAAGPSGDTSQARLQGKDASSSRPAAAPEPGSVPRGQVHAGPGPKPVTPSHMPAPTQQHPGQRGPSTTPSNMSPSPLHGAGGGFVAAASVAGSCVPVASFPSTGVASRDQVVAALHAALSAGVVSSLDSAVSMEHHIYQVCGRGPREQPTPSSSSGGDVSSAYLQRAYLLWSLLSPDSEGYSQELRELVLEGGVQPEALAQLDVSGTAAVQ